MNNIVQGLILGVRKLYPSRNKKNAAILLLFTIFGASITYAQYNRIEGSGVYVFSKAEFTVCRYGDITPLETKIIDNIEDLDKAGFPFGNVFRKVELFGTQILCTLKEESDGRPSKLYLLKDGIIEPIIENKENISEGTEELQPSIPLDWTYETRGNQLTFNLKYSFGDSRFNFPLEGEMRLTLNKQQ